MQNITTRNNCRRRRSKSSPISGRKQQPQQSSMGKALVLLHLASSATAFSSGGCNSITPLTTTRQPQHTVLQYRNGADEYFAIPTPSSSMGVSPPSTPTLKPTTEVIKEEQDMDEYLDYLQNRYTRMHHHPNNKRRRRSPTRSIVMMTTIFARLVPPISTADDTSSSFQEEEEQCHPLKVLGVSELASQRLRERLHVVSSSNTINSRRRSVVFVQLKQMTNRIISSIRILTNYFFSLNIIPELLVNKAGREFSVASLAMLLLVRPLFRGTFRQG